MTPLTLALLLSPAWADPAAVAQALSVRDPEPSCAAVEALTDDPVGVLQALADESAAPPWLPMRAAACLLSHPEGERSAAAWVVDPDRKGLARLVFGRLDAMEPAAAIRVARAALSGPWRAEAIARLAASEVPELRALVVDAP